VLKRLFLIIVVFLFVLNAKAQVPTNQDCLDAIPICQNVYKTTVSYSGTGNYTGEINSTISCLSSGEKNDVWYTFTVQQSGNLSFLITPNNLTEDYDWAVYNLTSNNCSDIFNTSSLSVSCNYSATGGTTGPNGGGSTDSEPAGGVRYNKVIPVTVGETYVVNVSNFSSSQNGYTIDFGGSTAKIFDTTPPSLKDVTTPTTCGANLTQLTFDFSENILCNTVQSDDFTLTGPDGNHNVIGWSSTQCAAGATYDNTFTITIDPPVSAAGDYSFCLVNTDGSVTDLRGNVAPPTCFTFTIPGVSVTTSFTAVSCNGGNDGTATASPSAAVASYSWSTNPLQNSATATGLIAGVYTVVVDDGGGCTSQSTVTVTQPDPVSVGNAFNDVYCNGNNDGVIVTWGGGGSGVYNYSWAPNGETTNAIFNLAPASYTVTITDDAGCSASSVFVISQPDSIIGTATATNTTCATNNGTINVNTTGGSGSGYTYSIDGVNWQASGLFSNLSSGFYIIHIIDGKGCWGYTTAVVDNTAGLNASVISQTDASCNGSTDGALTVDGNGGVTPYQFSIDGGTTFQATGLFTGLPAGNYNVIVQDNAGCSVIQAVNINEPTAITANITEQNATCSQANGTIQVVGSGGSGGYSYSIDGTTFQTGNNFINLAAAIYTITVTDANGCSSTSTSTINNLSNLTLTIIASQNISCNAGNNGYVVIAGGGSSGYTYSIDGINFQANDTFPNLNAATYTITANDQYGCSTSVTTALAEPAAITATYSSIADHCSQSNGAVTVTGSGGAAPFQYALASNQVYQSSGTFTGLAKGIYGIAVKDANGCISIINTLVNDTATPAITVTSKTNVSCNGDADGVINVIGSGTSGYTYSIDGITYQAGTAFNNLVAGTYTLSVKDANGCLGTDVDSILQPTVLTINQIALTNVKCFGQNSGSLSYAGIGGTPGYQFSTDGITYQGSGTFSNLAATNYTVTVKDANGCTNTTTAALTQPTQLTISSVIPVDAKCKSSCDGQATATITGGINPYTYSWSDNSTSINPIAFCAGNYSLTVTDANSCTATNSFVIQEPSLLNVNTTAVSANCSKADGSATASSSGGTGAYTYSWDNGETTAAATSIKSGNYCVTVTDNNSCTASSCINVPSIPGVVASISATKNSTCNGSNDAYIVAQGTGGGSPYTFTWVTNTGTPQTTDTAKSLAAGNYCVVIADANGCTSSTCATVTEPTMVTASVNGPATICYGNAATLNAYAAGGCTGYTFTWLPSNSNAASLNVNPGSISTYTLTASDCNQCASAPVTFTVNVGAPLVAAASPDASVCSGQSTILNASATGGDGNYSYTWLPSGSGNSLIASPASTTAYSVIVSDGCNTTPDTAFVTVSVDPLPVVNLSVDTNAGCYALCVNFTDNSTISNGTIKSWSWNFGDGSVKNTSQNPSHCFNNAGTFSVSLTASSDKGCINTSTVNNMVTAYDHPKADFTFTPANPDEEHSTVYFTDASANAISWLWNFNDTRDTNNNTVQNPSHLYADTGTYCPKLTVTNTHNCSDSISHCLYVSPVFEFYIPSAFTPNGDGKNDFFLPEGIYISKVDISVFDRWGNEIYHSGDLNKGWDGRANGGKEIAQNDVYVYRIIATDIFEKRHEYAGSVTLIK